MCYGIGFECFNVIFMCRRCDGGGDLEETGLSVRLPTTRSAQWNISDVEIFTVTIKSSSYKDTKTASQGETITFSNIPVGHYYVDALGKKSSGEITAKGTAEVDVVADQTSSAEVHMGRLNYCTVTFDRNVMDGPAPAQPASQNVTEGYTAIKPANPTATGKTFSYWSISDSSPTPYDFSTPVNSDITLYAIWDEVTYNITFDYNGGTDGSGNTSRVESTIHDQSPTQPVPGSFSKNGYTFSHWSNTPTGSLVNIESATADTTYYAVWDPVTYNITYIATPIPEIPGTYTYTVEETVDLPPPTYTGLTFAGWYDNSNFTGDALTSTVGLTGDKIFYAKWTVTVNFYQDVTLFNLLSSQAVVYNQCATEIADPTQGDQGFLGWRYNDGVYVDDFTFTMPITRDMDVYAYWGLGGMP